MTITNKKKNAGPIDSTRHAMRDRIVQVLRGGKGNKKVKVGKLVEAVLLRDTITIKGQREEVVVGVMCLERKMVEVEEECNLQLRRLADDPNRAEWVLA